MATRGFECSGRFSAVGMTAEPLPLLLVGVCDQFMQRGNAVDLVGCGEVRSASMSEVVLH